MFCSNASHFVVWGHNEHLTHNVSLVPSITSLFISGLLHSLPVVWPDFCPVPKRLNACMKVAQAYVLIKATVIGNPQVDLPTGLSGWWLKHFCWFRLIYQRLLIYWITLFTLKICLEFFTILWYSNRLKKKLKNQLYNRLYKVLIVVMAHTHTNAVT